MFGLLFHEWERCPVWKDNQKHSCTVVTLLLRGEKTYAKGWIGSFSKSLDGLCRVPFWHGLTCLWCTRPYNFSLYLLPVANLACLSEVACVCSPAWGVFFCWRLLAPQNNSLMRIVIVCYVYCHIKVIYGLKLLPCSSLEMLNILGSVSYKI